MLDKRIIDLLEKKLGQPIVSSSDCERLALDIEISTRQRLGFTTLKRLLGFTKEKAEARTSTLGILARYLGFECYERLQQCLENNGDSDFDNNSDTIVSASIPADMLISLSYSPNRFLTLRHIEKDRFIVAESINGSLDKGDIIFVDSFTTGLPMIAKDVIRKSKSLGRYVAGGNYGVTLIQREEDFSC